MKVINKSELSSPNKEYQNLEIINEQIADLYKQIKNLNLKLDRKEDDIKNIITEKDDIIKDIENKLIIQEKEINNNNIEIEKLNKRIEEFEIKLKNSNKDKENKINKNRQEINNMNNNILKEIDNRFQLFKKMNNDLNNKIIEQEYKINNKLDKNLFFNDKYEPKKNGFILLGTTGSGKTTLLNVLFGKEVGKVERSVSAVTNESKVYYYTLKNGKSIPIIDTPGLCDRERIEQNLQNFKKIKELLNKEKIQLKGLIFVINFQTEIFDSSDQESLLFINQMFPYKAFWKHILIIFTHYFEDPDEADEIKNDRDYSNKRILDKLMIKVKNVSDVINYKEIKTKYFNSFWPIKKDIQRKKNESNKDELEKELEQFLMMNPLY